MDNLVKQELNETRRKLSFIMGLYMKKLCDESITPEEVINELENLKGLCDKQINLEKSGKELMELDDFIEGISSSK